MPLPGMVGMLGGLSSKSLTYKTTLTSISSSDTITFASSQDIGSPSPDRVVVCATSWGRSSTNGTVSMTIGGISANKTAESGASGELNSVSFYAVVPTGSTAAIVMTWTGGTPGFNHSQQTCGVFVLYGFSTTPVDTYTNEQSSATQILSDLSPTTNQVVIMSGASTVSGATLTGTTGVTVGSQQSMNSQDQQGVFYTNFVSATNVGFNASSNSGLTISATMWQ